MGSNPVPSHLPVLLDKVIEYLDPLPGGRFIDNTGGDGSMSAAILERCGPGGKVLTLDCDSRTCEAREAALGKYGYRSIRRTANFENMAAVGREEGMLPVNGCLYDLGMSSRMVDEARYGASFRHDAPLDMRMDPSTELTAYEIVNYWPEREIEKLLKDMDERRWAGRIVQRIGFARKSGAIETTTQLASIIESAIPKRFHPRKNHPATKAFLAFRVAVNRERETLEKSLADVPDVLITGGVLVVICYSSFEDRAVRAMVRENAGTFENLTGKAVTPDEDEIRRNPRSRSARLRAYRKIA